MILDFYFSKNKMEGPKSQYPKIIDYVLKYKTDKGQETHVSMITPRQIFRMKDSDVLDNFWNLYNKSYKKEELGLQEKPEIISPLRVDFDFKFPLKEGKKRLYTDEDIENIVETYNSIIQDIIDPSEASEDVFNCILLEKPSPRTDNGFIKDGFHLHYPNFCTTSYVQDVYIRNLVMKKLETLSSFSSFRANVISKVVGKNPLAKLTLTQQIDMIVDKVSTKNWLLYGSRKEKGLEPFLITKCFDIELEEIELDEIFDDIENIPRCLSIRDCEQTTLREDVMNVCTQQLQKQSQRKKQNIRQIRPIEESYKEIALIKDGKIMEMIAKTRADDFDDWMRIGWTLFNIGQGCDEALDMWIEFSEQSDKFEEGKCEELWDKMEMRGLSIGTLFQIAKTDDPSRFNEWKQTQLDSLLYDAVATQKPTHVAVAKIMHKMFGNEFVCADAKHDLWYAFYNHRYHETDGGVEIIKKMTEDVTNVFLEFINKLTVKIQNNDFEKEKTEKRRDRAYKYIQELGMTNFCEGVKKMARTYFHDKEFTKKMNENRTIVCFENGVYDLNLGVFRDGSPDDYCTFSTGLKYNDYSYEDKDVMDLKEFLKKVFVNKDIRHYFLDFTATCLQGGNVNKIFAIMTGDTNGGKSVTGKLIKKAFGDYALDFPDETFIVSGRSAAGGARPDLARVRGKRIGFITEVSKTQEFDISKVKKLTGNDSFFARNLHEKGTDITPMFTAVVMCNKPPSIPASDNATWERIKIIPFESMFVGENNSVKLPATPEEQKQKKIFPRDPTLEEKLDDFVGPFMWLLLQRFKNYKKYGLKEPKDVKGSTVAYQRDNDYYKQFFEAKLEITDDENDYITQSECYREFKRWMMSNHPNLKKEDTPGLAEFAKEIEKKMKLTKSKKYKTRWIKLKFYDEEEEQEN